MTGADLYYLLNQAKNWRLVIERDIADKVVGIRVEEKK